MSLERLAIRKAVAECLRQAGTLAGNRVFDDLSDATFAGNAPAAMVYSRREDGIERFDAGGSTPEFRRPLDLAVEFIVEKRGDEFVADRLDLLAHQIEVAVLREIFLGFPEIPDDALAIDCGESGLVSAEIAEDAEGVRLVGAARLTFRVSYFTRLDSVVAEGDCRPIEKVVASYLEHDDLSSVLASDEITVSQD